MRKRFNYILGFAKPHWWKFIILFASIIITAFAGATFEYLFGLMVDEVFYDKNMQAFLRIVVLYGILFIFNQGMYLVMNMSWASLMTRFLFDIRYAMFKSVMRAKGKNLSGMYSGDIVSRMDHDAEEFLNFIHYNIFYLTGGVVSLIVCIGFIVYINVYLAALVVILTPVSVYTSRYFAAKAKPLLNKMRTSEGFLASWLFEILRGMQEIKILRATGYALSKFIGKTVKITRLKIQAGRVEVVSERANSGISLVVQLVLYVVATLLIWRGRLTVGGFVAVVGYFGQCAAQLNSVNNKAQAIAGNMVSIDRVIETLEQEKEQYNLDAPKFEISGGDIEFRQVDFSYNDGQQILNGFNLHISAGEKVAIVGRSGAGKSTVISLLQRIFEPDGGKILIDGEDISTCNLASLRSQIGVVQQQCVLFDGTVRYNLTFGDTLYSDNDIYKALEKAHLLSFIKSLPEGLDTRLGSGGQGMSGGQKQRLAVARIFLKDPKILIFDEATSSLDSEAEAVISQSWELLSRDRTVVIIAHRLSTIISANKVAVLSGGVIAGYDRHEALLSESSEYSELFSEQYLNGGEQLEEQ